MIKFNIWLQGVWSIYFPLDEIISEFECLMSEKIEEKCDTCENLYETISIRIYPGKADI